MMCKICGKKRIARGRDLGGGLHPGGGCNKYAKIRLKYLRRELRAERISYGELWELQSLAPFIDKGDTELLEAAGVPEAGAA